MVTIMKNLRRLRFLVALVPWLVVPQLLLADECAERETLRIVRIVEGGTRVPRLFIQEAPRRVANMQLHEEASMYIKGLREWVRRCRPQWNNRWHASLFSDAKYAGFKDEEALEPHVRDGSWQKNYLAEYEEQACKLTLYPLLPKRVKVIRVNCNRT